MSEFADLGEHTPSEMATLRADTHNERAEIDSLMRLLNQPGDHKRVFQYAGRAVVITKDKSVVLKSGSQGPEEIVRSVPRTANDGLLKGPIGMVASFVKFRATPAPGGDVACKIPPWVTKMIIDIYGEGLKPLAGVADFPVIGANNKLLCGRMGYDDVSRLFVDCSPITMDGNKFDDDPRAAYEFLTKEWLADFPFASDGDMARAIGVSLTIMSRRTRVHGGCPIPFVTSPDPETGKTLLTKCIVEAVTGQELPASAWDSKEDERRKMMLAIAMENPAAVLFDNIGNGHSIIDATLDKYVTSDSFSDRLLGKNETAAAPATTLPIFNGNNISAGSIDLESRSYEIRMEMPAKRPNYSRRDPLGWTHKNRVKIMQALVTIATAKVRQSFVPVSRFPSWAEQVGARLQYAANNKQLYPAWEKKDKGHWNDDLELLLKAMAKAAEKSGDHHGFTPGQMGTDFAGFIAEMEPEKTKKWCWATRSDGVTLKVDNGVIPAKSIKSILQSYRGHVAGGYRLSIEDRVILSRTDGRTALHYSALKLNDG